MDSITEIEKTFLTGGRLKADAERLAAPLFRVAMVNALPAGRTWGELGELAGAALLVTDAKSAQHRALDFARRVALRHTGEPAVIPWPDDAWLAQLPPDDRDTALAHVVQSASDGDLAVVEQYCRRAQHRLDEPTTPGCLRLAGAVGRGFAAVNKYEDAATELQVAVNGWLELGLPAEASYPLSEWLRYAGLGGIAGRIAELRAYVVRFRAADAPLHSRAFVRLALGRALIQVNDVQAGIDELKGGEDEWAAVAAADARHALRARWRWLHYAHLAREGQGREFLDKLLADGDSDQLHLAQLDLALECNADFKPHLEALLAVPGVGAEAKRALAARGVPPGEATAKIVRGMAWEYRY